MCSCSLSVPSAAYSIFCISTSTDSLPSRSAENSVTTLLTSCLSPPAFILTTEIPLSYCNWSRNRTVTFHALCNALYGAYTGHWFYSRTKVSKQLTNLLSFPGSSYPLSKFSFRVGVAESKRPRFCLACLSSYSVRLPCTYYKAIHSNT